MGGGGNNFGKQSGRHRLKNPPHNNIYVVGAQHASQLHRSHQTALPPSQSGMIPRWKDNLGWSLQDWKGKGDCGGNPRHCSWMDWQQKKSSCLVGDDALTARLQSSQNTYIIGSMELCYRPWRRSSVHLLWFPNLIDGSKSYKSCCICCKIWQWLCKRKRNGRYLCFAIPVVGSKA